MGADVRTVFLVGNQAVDEGVPKEFLGVPFLIGEDGQPDFRINEYLLARRNGDWAADQPYQGIVGELSGRKVLRANLGFLRNRAYQLDVFRRWCAANGTDYRHVSDLELDGFAEALEEGLVTGFEGGLQPQSVNQYLTSIIDLMKYGAQRGWREPLPLKMVMGRRGHGGPAPRPLVMRRTNPAEITAWYSEEQIEQFLGEFETAPLKMAGRLMHRMGLRLAEVIALRWVDFPTIERFRHDPASRSIRVKGKFGKIRHVPVDEEILVVVDRFYRFDRRRLEGKLEKHTDLLLIGAAANGRAAPLKPRSVQKEFVRARNAAGFKALSPHLMRHHYAAHFLLRAWRRKSANTSLPITSFDVHGGHALLSTDLLLLKESLGHERLDTTLKYLHAVSFLTGSGLPEAYSAELDGADA